MKNSNNVMKEIVAEPYLCFLAIIEMIMQDVMGANQFNQHYLAEYFGITVPENHVINVNNVQYSNDERLFGVHLEKGSLNSFFSDNNIPLHVDYYRVNPFMENTIDDITHPELRQNNYIVYTFSYGYLYGLPRLFNLGHVALLDKVISEDHLRIYDPGPHGCGYKEVERFVLYEAMRVIGSGIYVFRKNVHIEI